MLMTASRSAYAYAFAAAREIPYPSVAAFEQRLGYAIDRQQLEEAARVLACPLKANPPHWQHGRVIYAAARAYLQGLTPSSAVTVLDIGTAKGFSALCLLWALLDAGVTGQVHSVDVIDPTMRERRNTVAEVDGLLTLAETLAPWPAAQSIAFACTTGLDWLTRSTDRVHIAFVDGKHDGYVVRQEGKVLSRRQQSGDLVIFDDVQIPAVSVAVVSLAEWYQLEYVTAEPREYAIGRRR